MGRCYGVEVPSVQSVTATLKLLSSLVKYHIYTALCNHYDVDQVQSRHLSADSGYNSDFLAILKEIHQDSLHLSPSLSVETLKRKKKRVVQASVWVQFSTSRLDIMHTKASASKKRASKTREAALAFFRATKEAAQQSLHLTNHFIEDHGNSEVVINGVKVSTLTPSSRHLRPDKRRQRGPWT